MATTRLAPNAQIDPAFEAGVPGTYDITVTIEGVALAAPKIQNLDPATWTSYFKQQGLPVRATKVYYVSSTNARSTNAAADLFESLVSGSNTDRNVADVTYRVRVDVLATGGPNGNLGAVQGWGLAVAVLLAAAAVFTVIEYFTGKNILVDAVTAIARAVGGAVKEVLTDAGQGLGSGVLLAGLATVTVLYLFKKMGGRLKTKRVSF